MNWDKVGLLFSTIVLSLLASTSVIAGNHIEQAIYTSAIFSIIFLVSWFNDNRQLVIKFYEK